MSDDLISSTVSVVIGVILALVLTWLQNLWTQRTLRRKYSKVFSFELQQLKRDLDSAISSYHYYYEIEHPSDLSEEERRESGIQYPVDVLPYCHFKSKYTFLNENFDRIFLFKEDTIKSILKITSLMEEYDAVSQRNKNSFLTENLRLIQKEIPIALELLKKEEKLRLIPRR